MVEGKKEVKMRMVLTMEMQAMMNLMRYGHLVRYTFYYTKRWVRIDDIATQTATISQCPQRRFITLDLAHHTYRVTTGKDGGCAGMTGAMTGPSNARAADARPGTGDLRMTRSSTGLGPKRLDGIATTGTRTTSTMSMTNATGSCQNSDFAMTTIAYISSIHKPRAYCPIAIVTHDMPSRPEAMVASGGCKPTIHGAVAGAALPGAGTLLAMYRLRTTSSSQMRGHAMSMLTERGNVAWLYKPQADPLFTIPPGFTEAP